jgi:large subunit ribosomal protein L35
MPKQKTRKCISKRVKITGSGKVSRRKARQNHFNARQDGDHKRAKRTDSIVKGKDSKKIMDDIRASL